MFESGFEYAIENYDGYHRVLRLQIVRTDGDAGKVMIRAEEVARFRHRKHAVDWTETYRGRPISATG